MVKDRESLLLRPRPLYTWGVLACSFILGLLLVVRLVNGNGSARTLVVFGGLFGLLAVGTYAVVAVPRLELRGKELLFGRIGPPRRLPVADIREIRYCDRGPKGPWIAAVGRDGAELVRTSGLWATAERLTNFAGEAGVPFRVVVADGAEDPL